MSQPNNIAPDSAGRVYVADRASNRIQIFEPDGRLVAGVKQFGRPSDVVIDKNDIIYVADSQSNPTNNPGFKQGIRIGSAKDGTVKYFIPRPNPKDDKSGGEGVAADAAGNVFGAENVGKGLRKYAKQ